MLDPLSAFIGMNLVKLITHAVKESAQRVEDERRAELDQLKAKYPEQYSANEAYLQKQKERDELKRLNDLQHAEH